jgi:hypothetical protein
MKERMINRLTNAIRWRVAPAVVAIVLGGLASVPQPAQAHVWFGFGFPFYFGAPAYYPPPVYYPPPAYNPPPPYQPQAYAPPPAAYSPPAEQYSPAGGQACIAGTSVCPMEHPTAAGSACYCTTQEGRAWGHST